MKLSKLIADLATRLADAKNEKYLKGDSFGWNYPAEPTLEQAIEDEQQWRKDHNLPPGNY